MRCFKICVSLFAVSLLMVQLSFAQFTNRVAPVNEVLYEQIGYHEYQQGIVTNTNGIVPGVLLRDVNGYGEPIPGMKLTIVGGDDFVVNMVTDENGKFEFDQAEVGSYSAIVEYNGKLISLNFKVTAYATEVSSLGPDTGVSNNILRLVVINDGVELRFAATRGNALDVPSAVTTAENAACCCGAGGATSAGFGGAGGLGWLGGALGAAGLAAGIAAIADSNSSSTPASVATPVSR